MSTPSFFDFAIENQGGKKSMKFLEEMKWGMEQSGLSVFRRIWKQFLTHFDQELVCMEWFIG